MDSEFIELPAGKIDKTETPDECAIRELEEEIGVKTKNLNFIAMIHPAIGFANENMSLYLATDLVQTNINRDSDEFLELMHQFKKLIRISINICLYQISR